MEPPCRHRGCEGEVAVCDFLVAISLLAAASRAGGGGCRVGVVAASTAAVVIALDQTATLGEQPEQESNMPVCILAQDKSHRKTDGTESLGSCCGIKSTITYCFCFFFFFVLICVVTAPCGAHCSADPISVSCGKSASSAAGGCRWERIPTEAGRETPSRWRSRP